MDKPLQRIFVKPVPGGMVRDPVSLKLLDERGEWKPNNSYWQRRVLFRDCLEVTEEQRIREPSRKSPPPPVELAESKRPKKGDEK